MMKVTKINKWYNYDIRYEFKDIGKDDIQLLIYMNNELAFATKKNSFKTKDIKSYKIKLNKWHLPQYVPIDKTVLVWKNDKERSRWINFCKKFKYKTCYLLQEQLDFKLSSYNA